MNRQTSIEKMKAMKLIGMAQSYYNYTENNLYQDLTNDQYLAQLLEKEWEYRHNRKMASLLKSARFKATAEINNIDYTADRGLEKNVFERLATLDFISRKENIIITGSTGTGKSYLAQAIGRQACINLYKTLYFTASQLADQIQLSNLQGNYHKLIGKIQKAKLLIIDDFGLHPIDQQTRKALLDIIDHKYEQDSMIFTSQFPIEHWHQLIGEQTIADAILDRLIHSSHRIELKGKSLRGKKKIN